MREVSPFQVSIATRTHFSDADLIFILQLKFWRPATSIFSFNATQICLTLKLFVVLSEAEKKF